MFEFFLVSSLMRCKKISFNNFHHFEVGQLNDEFFWEMGWKDVLKNILHSHFVLRLILVDCQKLCEGNGIEKFSNSAKKCVIVGMGIWVCVPF